MSNRCSYFYYNNWSRQLFCFLLPKFFSYFSHIIDTNVNLSYTDGLIRHPKRGGTASSIGSIIAVVDPHQKRAYTTIYVDHRHREEQASLKAEKQQVNVPLSLLWRGYIPGGSHMYIV